MRLRVILPIHRWPALVLACFVCLVACATPPGQSAISGASSGTVTAEADTAGIITRSCAALPVPSQMPSFTGPYASDFESTFRDASSQFERDILSDGVITTAEMSEATTQYTQCLVNLGFTDVHWNFDGSGQLTPPAGFSADNQQAMADAMHPCDCAAGWTDLVVLYTSIGQNPDNTDSVLLMVRCLVRVGLEPESYTPQQYLTDLNNGYFETLKSDAYTKYRACNSDPAHAK